MKVLIVDTDNVGLSFAWRCAQAGHDVRWFVKPKPCNSPETGEGFKGVKRIDNWVGSASWADLVFVTSNDDYLEKLDFFKRKGVPVYCPSVKSANLEISRKTGMQLMEKVGIECAPYKTFKTMKEAEAYVRKTEERFVFKTLGDNEDKALTYVSKNPADLIGWMARIRKLKMEPKGEVMLQTFISGIEMGVSRWMSSKGWVGQYNESFEHKKLMSGNYGPNCYSADSEVLTNTGWKYWPDVTEDDEICTLIDGTVTFEKPSQLVVGDFEGELIGWESPYVDILVTPGHNMYVQDDHGRKDFWFEPANVTESYSRNILRGHEGWVGTDKEADVPMCSAFINDYNLVDTQPTYTHFHAWCALIGAYIADGSIRPDHRSIVFGNCPPHKQIEFTQIAADAGYSAKMYGKDLYVSSNTLALYCKTFGYSKERFVPDYIKKSSPAAIKSFLRGYGAGDGSRRQGNLTYTTTSKQLADDLQELALKAGYCANIRVRDRRGEAHFIGKYECVNREISYDVGVSEIRLKAGLTPETSYRQPYNGKVYCCTVTSHIIYVRRNGKACFLGQTGEMGTVAGFVPESKLGDETLGKLGEELLKLDHLGDTALGFIIDEKGKPWPTEWTCYDKATEVLTKAGWKLFKDVVQGELVATLNPESGFMEYQPAVNVIEKPFNGEMIHFHGDRSAPDLMVTPDHAMWAMDGNKGTWGFQTAERVAKAGNWKIKRSANWVGEEVVAFTLPGYTEIHQLNMQERFIEIEHPPITMHMDVWLKFLGLYISEGSMGKKCDKGIGYQVNIAQMGRRKGLVRDALADFPIKASESPSGFLISSRQLCLYLHTTNFGLCDQKFIPNSLMHLSQRQLNILLDHLIMGDGTAHKRNGQRSYYSTSVKLAGQVQELILKTGGLGRIRKESTAGTQMSVKGGKAYTRNHDIYCVSERKKLVDGWLDRRLVENIPYNDTVYCLNVPPHHLLYVRRNGNPSWCGNCRPGWPIFNMMLGSIKDDPAQWMLDALNGKDTTSFHEEIGVCLVATHGDFPHGNKPIEEVTGVPIYGVTKGNKKHLHPQGVKIEIHPDMDGDKIVERPVWSTAGDYVMVVTGYGKDVKQSAERAYKTVKQLHVSNMMVRDDVGELLEKQLPELHKHGYATHFEYDKGK